MMTDHNTSSCRICLEDGATLPIFEDTKEENSIHSKICLCMNENIQDITGYPQNVCYECNRMLDIASNFINKYRETCILLEKRTMIIKTESLADFTDNDELNNFSEVEIDFRKIKEEPDTYIDERQCPTEIVAPLQLKIKNIKVKDESDKRKKHVVRNRPRSETLTNKIASSILEGDFSWTGEKWCLKIGETTIVAKTKKRVIQQKEIKKEKPKEKKKHDIQKLCDLCGEVFKTADKLLTHKRKVHYKNPVQCTKCPRTLASEYYLNKHMKRKHEIIKDFICAACGHGFAFKAELSSHYKKVHDKKLRPPKVYSCRLCDKTYKCAKSVLVHERSVHTGQRPAECSICGSSFYHEDYLKEHMRLHTGETPFKCPVCGRGYAQRCNMKSHLRIHRISELDAATLNKIKPNYLKLLKV